MSQNHRIKGGTTDEAFQEQSFLWERRASVGSDFDLINFQHTQEQHNTRRQDKYFLFNSVKVPQARTPEEEGDGQIYLLYIPNGKRFLNMLFYKSRKRQLP